MPYYTFEPNKPNLEFIPIEQSRYPYIENLYEYKLDGSEGIISFNGYYYVNDLSDFDISNNLKKGCRDYGHVLPEIQYMSMYTIADKPPIIQKNEDGVESTSYEYGEKHFYKIEIYRRELFKKTDRYSTIDDDGEPMKVCFFPTNEQKIYFRILEEINDR